MTSSLRDEINAIYVENGRLTPALVRDTARDPDHPLHSRFEWDDTLAGELYRLEQAHELIKSARVVYKPAKGKNSERSVRAFHAVYSEDDQQFAYKPVEEIVHDEFSTQLVMREMERDWKVLKNRYDHFREFWQMIHRDEEQAG